MLGLFSAVRIAYAGLYPHLGVAGTMPPGERGSVATRGCVELGSAGEGDERRIKQGFSRLQGRRVKCMRNHTRRFCY